jgi:hypothetical protein
MTEGKNGKYVPAIGGKFQETFGRMFDMVLITETETKSTLQQVKVPNSSTPITKSVLGETEYFAWTRPPSNLYNCGVSGDGLGGYNKLPLKIPNTFRGLMEAWGRADEIPNNETAPKEK